MDIKDLVLQTIDELSQPSEDSYTHQSVTIHSTSAIDTQNMQSIQGMPSVQNIRAPFAQAQSEALREECEFLEMLQERLLVLFEGLKAEHNKELQTKLNLTINFLEYELSVITERLSDIKR
ncbi:MULTISPECIES: CiaD-like domain-containing protein [Helicobacter]|uniref:Campylobacter invasion antigen D C-terminal domain-containing protein n=2 Tax=Helicobacter typhlonius TaxID=76936 RepID=A0A099UCJ2_9HELI|nr:MULTISPECIES: hypothetical protein [Helicobacter]TLD78604.1 hypothetical protein LS75_004625 [Helicobacter typhlonius]TLD89356.1 hypothetical protein LS67_002650 [Helicobacter sp. MIT 03-1616]CUU40146.1 FIG00710688: Hypothetical protein [Helicobacter typhlonius]